MPETNTTKGLVWIRRDLRLHDHAALHACINENSRTELVFVFDKHILQPLAEKSTQDKRVHFIAESLLEIAKTLETNNAGIHILYGDPVDVIPNLINERNIDSLYVNRDYSPYPRERDAKVRQIIESQGKKAAFFQDHVLVEPTDCLKDNGQPYTVFTPYSKRWRDIVSQDARHLTSFPIDKTVIKNDCSSRYNTVEDILKIAGFQEAPAYLAGGTSHALKQLNTFEPKASGYGKNRDFPAKKGTSEMAVYIRHGCLSVRDLFKVATQEKTSGHSKWFTELIWREFYQSIAYHFPQVKTSNFNPKYDAFPYVKSNDLLEAWQQGQTGYPIIDAAMRCLNQTGWMHNRLRMVVASFLTKILLLHWQSGEAYFAWKLLDYEFASNNGGWQWASGSGCDAAPYFRIFNPYLQSLKFDPDGSFIKEFCPELRHLNAKDIHEPIAVKNYPEPIVNYKKQRELALSVYNNLS